MENAATITQENGRYHYFDKAGTEIHDGDNIVWDSGKEETVYLSTQNELGVDATNPAWVENGRAEPGEYGLYPLTEYDLKNIKRKDG